MRLISYVELDLIVERAQSFIGDKISDIIFSEDKLMLGFSGSSRWMTFVPGGKVPILILSDRNPLGLKKQIKPLYLFLKSHLMGKSLVSIERRKGFGRIVDFQFEDRDGDTISIEAILIPPDGNITAKTKTAGISLHKPRDIVPVEEKAMPQEVRTPDQIFSQWLEWRAPSIKTEQYFSSTSAEERQAKILRSLDESVKKINQDPAREIADWLSERRSLDELPKEWETFVDRKRSVNDNIEELYARAKKNKVKLQGLEKRRTDLLKEPLTISPQRQGSQKPEESLLKDAKGRTFKISEDIVAYIGKSADDNLQLLRNARPWHLWVHAKDFPSSHGVIRLPKNADVGPEILRQVGQWILEQTLSEKVLNDWKGVKCDFVVCPIRHVTPIKGDKKGKVTFKNETTFRFIVS